MTTQSSKPKNIKEYIKTFPENTQEKLNQIWEILKESAPGAKDDLKWNQPALSYDWILFQFAGFKNHVSLYPTPSIIEKFQNDLKVFQTGSSSVQFPLDKPLPLELIKKMAKERILDAKNGVKWM